MSPTTIPEAAVEQYAAVVATSIEDIEAYWRLAMPAVYGLEYESISDTIAYHSRTDAPLCAGFRLRAGNAYYCGDGDYIAWDEAGLLMPFYLDIGDFAVTFVLAHEWGHAVAARAGANLPANIFGELQADCFAGAYTRWAESSGLLEPGDTDEAVFAMYQVRDPAGTPWLDPNAHGTALDRIGAYDAGYQSGPGLCANYSLPTPSFLPPDPPELPMETPPG